MPPVRVMPPFAQRHQQNSPEHLASKCSGLSAALAKPAGPPGQCRLFLIRPAPPRGARAENTGTFTGRFWGRAAQVGIPPTSALSLPLARLPMCLRLPQNDVPPFARFNHKFFGTAPRFLWLWVRRASGCKCRLSGCIPPARAGPQTANRPGPPGPWPGRRRC